MLYNNYVNGFITSNIDSIYLHTKSLDYKKYVILLRQIAKKRLELNRTTRINWEKKEIIAKQKKLNEEQVKAMIWLLDNNFLVESRVKYLVEKFKNGKTLVRKEMLKPGRDPGNKK